MAGVASSAIFRYCQNSHHNHRHRRRHHHRYHHQLEPLTFLPVQWQRQDRGAIGDIGFRGFGSGLYKFRGLGFRGVGVLGCWGFGV